MTKSLNIDIMFSWEIGLLIVFCSIILIIYGIRQSKKVQDDFDNFPLIKPTTKILLGSFALIVGLIQLLPLLKNI